MRIAVTGASGFIGGAVAARLGDAGHDMIGFGRTPRARMPKGRSHSAWAGDYAVWDITAGSREERVDAVVHCAALADDRASAADATRVNVDGTRNVIASFRGARFVHLSTSSVYDALRPTVNAPETEPLPTRYLSEYSRTKARAEGLFAGENAAILRPHAVYGPGDTTLLPRILAAIRGAKLRLPDGARVLHTLTNIENLTDAVELAIDSDARGIFNVGDALPVILADVLSELLRKQGRADVAITSVPYTVAYAAAAVAERLTSSARLSRYAVSQLGVERTLDLTRARAELGYAPTETSLDGAESW